MQVIHPVMSQDKKSIHKQLNISAVTVQTWPNAESSCRYLVRGLCLKFSGSRRIQQLLCRFLLRIFQHLLFSSVLNMFISAPGPPEGLTLSSKEKMSVTVTWTETTKPNGVLTGYIVCYHEKIYNDEVFTANSCQEIPKSTQHTFQPLKPGKFSRTCL